MQALTHTKKIKINLENNKKLIKNVKSLSPSPCSKRFCLKIKTKKRKEKQASCNHSLAAVWGVGIHRGIRGSEGTSGSGPAGSLGHSAGLKTFPAWFFHVCHATLISVPLDISGCRNRLLLHPKLRVVRWNLKSTGRLPCLAVTRLPTASTCVSSSSSLLPLLFFSSPFYFWKCLGASEKAQLGKVLASSLST